MLALGGGLLAAVCARPEGSGQLRRPGAARELGRGALLVLGLSASL